MISVEEAEQIIQSHIRDYGTREVACEQAMGQVLAEELLADRDLPPFNRSAVDGIAIDFGAWEKGERSFRVQGIQAAGQPPLTVSREGDCVEIMTGAAVDPSLNAVIRYEDIAIKDGLARVKPISLKPGQHIHRKGADKKKGALLAKAGQLITPALLGMAATVGKTCLRVRNSPRVLIVSTGDEMVAAGASPSPWQLRRSNGITIQSVLRSYGIQADMRHLNDDYEQLKKELSHCFETHDVLLMSGGVSMGKFDHIPAVMNELGAKKHFHKIKQRPGKPFWFGTYHRPGGPGNPDGTDNSGGLIFAFPGNPVSAFMCLHRYFLPWLEASLGLRSSADYAILQSDLQFIPPLQYFVQVQVSVDTHGQKLAMPLQGNGSGDLSQLVHTNAFMELPAGKDNFNKGEAYRLWRY